MRTPAAYLRRSASAALALLLTATLAPAPAHGVPSTPDIATKQAEALAAQVELDRMNSELEVQIEQYNAITEALDKTRDDIRRTELDLETATRDLAEARSTLAKRAASIYKQGGGGVLEVFLGARSFEDFVVRMDLVVRISRTDAEAVASVKDAKSRVEATERALQQRQAEQVALQAEASNRASGIEADMRAQERFVSRIEGEVRTLIAEEEERQRQLALERARQAALAAAAAAQRSGQGGSASTVERDATDPGSLKAGRPEVVDIALQYLGVPYVWGGSTPAGFDCSGLTQYCYRQIGITLPRVSQSQYRAGQHIARDRVDLLVPGDLVFFGTNGDGDQVHHVGIYVGDGNYLHAPFTGAVVRVDSLTSRISNRGDYVGASRF